MLTAYHPLTAAWNVQFHDRIIEVMMLMIAIAIAVAVTIHNCVSIML